MGVRLVEVDSDLSEHGQVLRLAEICPAKAIQYVKPANEIELALIAAVMLGTGKLIGTFATGPKIPGLRSAAP